MPEEKDLSYVYMQKGYNGSQMNIFAGRNLTDPVYCLHCEMKRPLDPDFPMNLMQAMDHVLDVHIVAGHGYDPGGWQRLERNAARYHKWKTGWCKTLIESTKAARLKRVLARG